MIVLKIQKLRKIVILMGVPRPEGSGLQYQLAGMASDAENQISLVVLFFSE